MERWKIDNEIAQIRQAKAKYERLANDPSKTDLERKAHKECSFLCAERIKWLSQQKALGGLKIAARAEEPPLRYRFKLARQEQRGVNDCVYAALAMLTNVDVRIAKPEIEAKTVPKFLEDQKVWVDFGNPLNETKRGRRYFGLVYAGADDPPGHAVVITEDGEVLDPWHQPRSNHPVIAYFEVSDMESK